MAPLPGETVGVGMPVIVNFDVPVTDRASFEKHMKVTSTPEQAGGWYWLSDNVVHYRPKKYWKAGTRSASTSTSTASTPATASTARRTATSTSPSATRTSTRWT